MDTDKTTEQEIKDSKIITNADKVRAIEALHSEVVTFIKIQGIQDKANRKIFNWIKYIMFAQLVGLCIGMYIFFKPQPATLMDINHIRAENENLNTRMKLFEYQKQDFQKEKEIFVTLKANTDSDLSARRQNILNVMSKIYSQDSLSNKRKPMIVDHVNAKKINTVNAKNVTIKK